MNSIIWRSSTGTGTFIKDGAVYDLSDKADLGFIYTDLYYDEDSVSYKNNDQSLLLSAGESRLCGEFIAKQHQSDHIEASLVVYGFDAEGSYIGVGAVTDFTAYTKQPPLQQFCYFNSVKDTWVVIHGVDASGHYIGNVPLSDCTYTADSEPPNDFSVWDTVSNLWVYIFDLELYKRDVIQQTLDRLSLARRALFNGVNHQLDVYSLKVKEATLVIGTEGSLSALSLPFLRTRLSVDISLGVITAITDDVLRDEASSVIAAHQKSLDVLIRTEEVRLRTNSVLNNCQTKELVDMAYTELCAEIDNF